MDKNGGMRLVELIPLNADQLFLLRQTCFSKVPMVK